MAELLEVGMEMVGLPDSTKEAVGSLDKGVEAEKAAEKTTARAADAPDSLPVRLGVVAVA